MDPGRERDRVRVDAIGDRTDEIVEALRAECGPGLAAPTRLAGWSRLTVACHLRYGAGALHRMSIAALAGRPTSYYPTGRDHDRPGTLGPPDGESPGGTLDSLSTGSNRLRALWSSLARSDWHTEVREPPENPDLGPLRLADLALLRLTEVEVHGTDLDLGLREWSPRFVDEALPFRLERLNRRRARHPELLGTWLLTATDGPSFRVTVDGTGTRSRPAGSGQRADAVIEATSRDLLALLLGRPTVRGARITGDRDFGARFTAEFPGP